MQSPTAEASNFPTVEDVRAAIPPDGIELKSLVSMFKSRVASRSGDFISLVKLVGKQDPTTKKIIPKEG